MINLGWMISMVMFLEFRMMISLVMLLGCLL